MQFIFHLFLCVQCVCLLFSDIWFEVKAETRSVLLNILNKIGETREKESYIQKNLTGTSTVWQKKLFL